MAARIDGIDSAVGTGLSPLLTEESYADIPIVRIAIPMMSTSRDSAPPHLTATAGALTPTASRITRMAGPMIAPTPLSAAPAPAPAPRGVTAELHRACVSGSVADIDMLALTRADLQALDEVGDSALFLACQRGDVNIVRALLKKADELGCASDLVNQPNDRGPLIHDAIRSAYNGDFVEIIGILLDHGASMNCQDGSGDTPLARVLIQYNGTPNPVMDSIADLLLARDADVNAKNHLGITPLHWACERGNVKYVNILLDQGANINATCERLGSSMQTPLCLACQHKQNREEIIKILIDRGADPNLGLCSLGSGMPGVPPLTYRNGQTDRALLIAQYEPVRIPYNVTPPPKTLADRAKQELILANSIGDNEWDLESDIFLRDIPAHIRASDLPEGQAKCVQQAFLDSASPVFNARATADAINQGKLVILRAHWLEHAITLVFCNGYLAICNRGDGAEGSSSVKFFRINGPIHWEDVYRICTTRAQRSTRRGTDYFYNELPSKLCASQKPNDLRHCKKLGNAMHSSWQTVGNCPYTSAAGALKAAMCLVTIERDQPLTEEARILIRKKSREILFRQRLSYLEEYLKLHPKESRDNKLVRKCLDMARSRMAKYPLDLADHPNIRAALCSLEYKHWTVRWNFWLKYWFSGKDTRERLLKYYEPEQVAQRSTPLTLSSAFL